MCGCKSWTIKKAEHWIIDVFELWCWRRLLITRRSNQSILKEISPEYSLEGLTRKLKLQYFGHLMWRTDSLEKTWCWERVKAGGEGENRGWGGWMAPPTQCTWIWASSRRWWWAGSLVCCSPWACKEQDTTEWLNNKYNMALDFNIMWCKRNFMELWIHALFTSLSYAIINSTNLDKLFNICLLFICLYKINRLILIYQIAPKVKII